MAASTGGDGTGSGTALESARVSKAGAEPFGSPFKRQTSIYLSESVPAFKVKAYLLCGLVCRVGSVRAPAVGSLRARSSFCMCARLCICVVALVLVFAGVCLRCVYVLFALAVVCVFSVSLRQCIHI